MSALGASLMVLAVAAPTALAFAMRTSSDSRGLSGAALLIVLKCAAVFAAVLLLE